MGVEERDNVLAARGSDAAPESVAGPKQPGPVSVEELAGPEDYWLTLTDAARVTRRQEVTIRRWVAAGSLPVRNRPLGINKRTRHVRASDLAQLSPIVDASATISGATAQLDLVSIPLQQAQILQQQRELDQQLETLSAQVTAVTGWQGAQLEEHQAHLAQIEQAAQHLQKEITTNRQQVEKHHTSRGRQLTGLQQRVGQLSTDLQLLQEEQRAVQVNQERAAERQREQEEIQRGHLARIEQLEQLAERIQRIETQQLQDAKDRRKQQRRIDAVTAEAIALEQNLRQMEVRLGGEIDAHQHAQQVGAQQQKLLETSLAQLRQDLQQQTGEIGKEIGKMKQVGQEDRGWSQQIADRQDLHQEQLEKLVQQVAARLPEIPPPGVPLGKPARQRRTKRSSRSTRGA